MATLFQNDQWAVTNWGLQAVHLEFNIAAHRLLEQSSDGTGTYVWPIHMGRKVWIDMRAFEEAFRKALEVQSGQYNGQVNATLLDESFVIGWMEAEISKLR